MISSVRAGRRLACLLGVFALVALAAIPASGLSVPRRGAQARVTSAPRPSSGSVAMNSLSCGAAGSCTAVGSYHCARGCLGEPYPFLVSENDGVWSRAVVPRAPAGSAKQPWPGSDLAACVWGSDANSYSACTSSGVSCPAAGSCWAMSRYSVARYSGSESAYQVTVLREKHGTWSPSAVVRWRPPYIYEQDTTGIACPEAGTCVGVADLNGGSEQVWNGKLTPSQATRPEVVDVRHGKVVGALELAQPRNVVRPLPLPGDPTDTMNWIASVSASSCAATGEYPTNACRRGSLDCPFGEFAQVVYSEFHGRWSSTPVPRPPDAWVSRHDAQLPQQLATYGGDPELNSPGPVACGAAGSCTAIGAYIDARTGSVYGELIDEVNGRWQPTIEAPLPADAVAPANAGQEVDLTSISCPSGGSCVAVGDYHASNKPQFGTFTLILTEAHGVWAHVTSVTPQRIASFPGSDPNYAQDTLASVSCTSVGNCVAVGSSWGDPLIATETSGNWNVSEPTPPATSGDRISAELSDVDCPSSGNCSAIGTYKDHSGRTDGWVLDEKSGVWGHGSEVQLP